MCQVPPQLSFADTQANLLSLTSFQGYPHLSVPTSCVKAKGTVNTSHWDKQLSAQSRAYSHSVVSPFTVPGGEGKCQSGELGNHDEKTPETELNELHPDLLVDSLLLDCLGTNMTPGRGRESQ